MQNDLSAESLPPLLLTPMSGKAPASPVVTTGTEPKPPSAPRYVVQLCESAQPIEPLDVPQLDLFDLYHLYCIRKSRDGGVRHSLCLGYFKDPEHAKTVAAYLAPHFHDPLIVQIGVAEIIASLRQKFLPGKDVGASGQHAAVVLATTPPRPARVRVEVPKQSPGRVLRVRSVWSRLLGSLHRSQALT